MIKHIKDTVCPHCKAAMRKEGRGPQHSCMEWFEYREFECGCKLEFVVNFMRVEETEKCSKTKEYRTMEIKRDAFKQRLIRYIGRADIDDEYREKIFHSLDIYGIR